MIYDFAAKIKGIKSDLVLSKELFDEKIIQIGKSMKRPLKIHVVMPDDLPIKELFIKTEVSISTMPVYQERELEEAIITFKEYLEKIAVIINGEVSENEAFFINSKTFGRLYT